MSEVERNQLLVEWNRTGKEYPRDKCVHQLFEEQVERTPEATAIVFEEQSLTYRELNARANSLAHHLRSLGVRKDELVAVLLERSLDVPVAILGVLKAGGAFVPLALDLPPERIDFILHDTQVRVVLTQTKLLTRLPATEAEMICLDEFKSDHLTSDSFRAPQPSESAEDLAYAIYTSGSTGQPKGVLITQGQIALHSLGIVDFYGLNPADRGLHFASLGFDFAIENLLPPLLAGARVVMRGPDLWDPSTLTRRIRECGITVISLMPSYWSHWLASLDTRTVADSLGSLRLAIIGGDVMPVAGVRRWRELRLEKVRLINMYGPTEATITALGFDVDADWLKSPALERVPIGRPLANRCAYVLDERGRPVAIGVTAELYLGGEGIARGYLNRAELTAERFLPDPFSNKPGARLYRTGDLARYLPDGNIEFLGRVDQQVKIRGYRIELGEIETALGSHPAVAACAVVARDCGGDDKTLAAFVVAREQSEPSIESLRSWLSARLPEYMAPSRYVVVGSLPLTGNGKVDRKALEKSDGVELAVGTGYVAPRSERERKLAEIWQAVLQRDRVGVHDNFFDLGGHSLLAVAICSSITRLLSVEAPLRAIFEHPTIEGLAKKVEFLGEDLQSTLPIEETDRHQPLPMSFAQQRMWLLQQTLADPATYNEPVAFRLSGRVDRERVRRALQVILERHEVLRTALVQQGESLVQQVAAANDVPLPWLDVDFRTLPLGRKQAALEERLLDEARRPFDLAQAPLWRAVWIKLGEDEQVLGITFHHSIVDEWTLRLFFREWERLYAADGRLELAGIPELPVQYADFAAWQRQRLTGELLERQRRYWREQLQELPPALELPTDMVRPVRLTGRGAVHDFRLTGSVVTRLRELAREERTTLFAVALAAFHVWLYRYTGQTDVMVGTPISNRDRPEIQSLLGFFLNTLPIRVRLDGSSSFRQVLTEMRELLLGAFSHPDLPFEQMVEMAVKERAAGQQPLYQVMFFLLEEGLPAFALDEAEARPLPVTTRTSKNELTLGIEAVGETWSCRFEYSTDLFTAETTARMGRHLAELLRSITEDPEKPISELNLMPAAERHQILVEWNKTEREYPRDKCIHQLFEEQVERTPEAVAVVFEERSLTYRELDARASKLDRHLRSLGVGPDVLVGLCMERSPEMVMALLGILKAGAAYWALEENLPEERLRFLIGDARPKVILTSRKTAGNLAGIATVTVVEDLLASPPGQAVCVARSSRPEDPAYVSYTSGSTGRPKGVVVAHRGVVRLVKGADYVSLTSEETLLHLSPLSFDASTFELWGALLNGGRVALLPAGQPTLDEIGAAIRQHGVTTLWLTAGLFHLMVDERLNDLKPLRQLLAGGDVLCPERVAKARRALPECRLINGYGPTENTTFTCCYTVADERQLIPTVPIGRPIPNTRVYVLDPHLQPAPIGVAGELFAGGDGVACGYLNQPQLTADRFIPDPFSPGAGARLYRTGDRVRRRPDGNIEFLGRVDAQVKIRGFRVELGEIETVLNAQPEVRQSVVLVREDTLADKRVVAYLVATAGEKPDASVLRARLAAELAEYMLPSAFVWLDELPLTPNGKLDRESLPAPEKHHSALKTVLAAPRTSTEELLAKIWCDVLGVESVGIYENFFELGGHSLKAVQVISRTAEALKVDLSLRLLFDFPTIASLAEELATYAATTSLVPPLIPLPREGPLPLSFAQQRLWFLHQLEPESAAYHVPMAVHLKGSLDVDALQHALQTIIQHHEILRTTFASVGGSPVQIIGAARPLSLKLVDLREASAQERDIRTQQLLIEESDRAFDLARGPLVRFTLLQLNEDENILILVMHHIIVDGWSIGVLFGELGRHYDAFCAKAPISLPEAPLQYADFALWQQQTSQEKTLQEDNLYWKEKLAGAPASLVLPTDHPPGLEPAVRAAQQTVILPESLIQSVVAVGSREGSTPFMTMMTALVIALHRWTGQQEFVVGTVIAGRNRREIETLIGCFMNFLPLRVKLSGEDTGLGVLTRVKGAVLEGLAHQDYPFQKIVEAVNPERKLNENPLYNVAFLLQNYPRSLLGSDRLQATLLPVESRSALLDLRFVAEETDTRMTLTCEYRQALFNAKTMEALLAFVCRTLEMLARDPQRKLSDFERSATLEAQLQTARSSRAKQCITIAATFTAEPVEESLQFWISELHLPVTIAFTRYNQVFQQLLDPASLFASNHHGMNVVLIRLEDWLGTGSETKSPGGSHAEELLERNAGELAERNARELLQALTTDSHSATPLLLCICPASKASVRNAAQAALFHRIEILLADGLKNVSHVSLLTSAELLSLYPVADYDDPHGNELGHIPYTPLLFAALGTMISRKFHALNRAPYKVILLDCDQTLWSGVCGEDGAKGIAIDPPRLALQHFMCAQRDAGMLLCLCSKNNEEDVAAAFASRPEMPLRWDDFAACRINWHPKSENLKSLAKELRLGLESFIFMDDNPLECAEVEANCPQVLTLLLPRPERISRFLNHCWALDHGKTTTEDQQRTVSYLQNREREKFQTKTGSLAKFIAGLNLEIRINESTADQLPRVAQLTERTNQFNCTTRRRTERDLRLLLDSGNKVLAVSVRDRFGDYGLVGVIIHKETTEAIAVDTFLLSCRVLGKGVEHQMLAHLGRLATARGAGRVDIPFRTSLKNQPALDFLEKAGTPFRQEYEGGFVFRFSAGFAAALTLNSQEQTANGANGMTSSAGISGNGHAEVAAGAPSTLHRWIATGAHSASAVLEAIESRARPRDGVHAAYAAPSTELGKQLCEIWEQSLRIQRVGVHDNFFDLGGHSLLAARLTAEINNLLGCNLPIAALFQSPTVESLTRRLTEEHWAPAWSSLVPLQALGSNPPVYFIHGGGGDVYRLLRLAQRLAPDQPAYGLQAVGLDGRDVPHTTVEQMAAHYVREIRTFQPEGPYDLAGYSMGGLIAYEMAQQLHRQGQRVALLAMLDTRLPSGVPAMIYAGMMLSYLSERFHFHFDQWRKTPARERIGYFRRRWAALRYWLAGNRAQPSIGTPRQSRSEPPQMPGFSDYYQVVAGAYQIRRYPGRVDFFLCDDNQPGFVSAWKNLARGGVRWHRVSGKHLEMLNTAYVDAFAQTFKNALDQARGAAQSGGRDFSKQVCHSSFF